jgi:hypothetical protein
MHGMNSGELAVGVAALAVTGGFAFWRVLLWIRNSPIHPDPWDTATQQAVEQPDAPEVCYHCATPLPPGSWFCEHCGRAVGPYNNLMPYVNAFSEGEVYRSGVLEHVRRSPLLIAGYLLISLSYLIFAPIYWFLLFKNLFARRPTEVPSLPANVAG